MVLAAIKLEGRFCSIQLGPLGSVSADWKNAPHQLPETQKEEGPDVPLLFVFDDLQLSPSVSPRPSRNQCSYRRQPWRLKMPLAQFSMILEKTRYLCGLQPWNS